MTNLLRKDLILNRRNFSIFVPMATVMMCFYARENMSAHIFVTFGCLFMAMIPIAAIAQEDKFKAMMLNCSLPVDRKTIIRSKYLGAWLVGLAGFLYIALIGMVLPWADFLAADFFNVRRLIGLLTLLTFVIGGLFPFALRFGVMGLIVFFVSFQLLGTSLFALTSSGILGFSIRGGVQGAMHALNTLKESLGFTLFGWVWLMVLAILNTLSYLLAQRLFRNKDL